MKKLIKETIAKALAGIRLAYRASLAALSKGAAVQLMQADALAGETAQAVEFFQQFGFTSAPPPGTQLIVLPLGGRTAHSVVIATEHGAYRLDVASGEACLYSQWGDRVHVRERRIELRSPVIDLRASELLRLSAPEVEIHADERLETDTGGYGEAVNCTGGGWSIDSYRQGASPITTEHGVQPPEVQ